MKKILLACAALSGLLFYGMLSAHEKSAIDKVYQFLSTKWYYYDLDGNKVTVSSLGRRSRGTVHEVIVNGQSLDPALAYDSTGANILDPSKRNRAKPKEIIGSEKGLMKGITEAHNRFRRQTGGGLPDLVWDEEIAAYAQRWAEYLRDNNGCSMQHRSGRHKERSYGENLAWSSGRELEADDVAKMWYDEIKDYNYAANSCSAVCSHYTQVVWRTSKKVGCGMARCGRSEVWACNYEPPGNWVGQKPY